jgi:signal transduction histidine kinase
VLTVALLLMLPALALLQYRWVGQLGDAARERMQRNLHNAAQQFNEAFDSEVARAFLSLQVDSGVVRDQAWDRYADRYAAWARTSAYPDLVEGVYLIDALEKDLRLRRWDPQARSFASAAWEGPLETARAHFASELAAFASGDRRQPDRGAVRIHEALLVAPLIDVRVDTPRRTQMQFPSVTVFGFTVIHLDMPLIREQLLPALARRHFSQAEGDAYRVAIVDATNASRVIYTSSPDAPIDPAQADVNVSFFGPHRDPVMFLAHGAAREIGDRRNMVFSVFREKREDGVTVRARVANTEGARWRLLAQHERGSLEAAVGGVRYRNLIISFGILLLMGVSIGLLALSSRRAQRLAQQQMEFVAGVSHELRTPVAVIRSAADNLSHGVVGDPERVRRYGDALQVEARRLGEMVERVLQFAGIESGKPIARAPLAIDALIREAVDAALPPGDEGFVIERHVADNLPPVLGDAASLRSAIQNLVANALKYGGSDRWVGVRAETGADRRDVRVIVQDHGRGIAAEDLPHIFDPFYRGANATSRQIQGSGLGLALVRRIARAHSGRVTVETHESAGSTFILYLPVAASTPEAATLRSPNEAPAR